MGSSAPHDWFLAEWLTTLRMKQARLMEIADWDKRKTSELVNGKQRYNRDIINEAAAALNLQPYELLMHPDEAMAIRRMRESALRIAGDQQMAAESRAAFKPPPPDLSKTAW